MVAEKGLTATDVHDPCNRGAMKILVETSTSFSPAMNEPGWRFKIRNPLLMTTGEIWQGGYILVHGDVISS
jgi:hypothetical protein